MLKDGGVVEGDIVVGADGAYSAARMIMWEHAGEGIPKEDKTAMIAKYQCLFGCSTLVDGLCRDEMWETHAPRLYFQLFTQPGRVYFLVVRPLERTEVYPNWTRYSDEDAQAFAEKVLDHPIGRSLKFRDIWDARIRYRLANLEQGVLKKW